nr:hypothetical protein [Tanacetum cinerariifolium]
MMVNRGVSYGGQSVFIYVVVVVVADHGHEDHGCSGCEFMEGQVVLVVVPSSGTCDEEWWSCNGDFLFNVLVVVKDGDDKSFWLLGQYGLLGRMAKGQPVNMDNASIIATFSAGLCHEAIMTSTAPYERSSAETLFELICTWLHKGNDCESATGHDQLETEGPFSTRIWSSSTSIAPNHILFYFNSTRGLESLNTGIYGINDKGKEKILEGEEISSKPLSAVHDEECMHDGLVVPPMPTASTPPVLEVTVSRPFDPICRIASQPRAPEPPYAPPPPPPLPTLHGVISLPPLQDVVPSLQPPPPLQCMKLLLHLKYQHLLCKLFPHHLHDHLWLFLIHLQSMLNQLHHLLLIPSSWSVRQAALERPSLVGYLRSITEMKATNIFENGKTDSVESNAYEDPNSYKIQNVYDLPRMPPWFSSSGNQKLCQSLAGILRLVSLSLVKGSRSKGNLSVIKDIPLSYLRKLIDQAVDNMKSMFRNNISDWDVSSKRDLRSQLIDSIGSILHEYLSPEIWNLPLEQSNVVTGDINFHFCHDKAMLHQVMIDRIGIFNLSLKSDFVSSGFLHSSLYVLLENLICSNFKSKVHQMLSYMSF